MNRFEEMRFRRLVRESIREVGNRRYLFEAPRGRGVRTAGGEANIQKKELVKLLKGKLDVSKGPEYIVNFLNGPGADPKVRDFIGRGLEDGDRGDETVDVTEGSATVGSLIPTQNEIEFTKSVSYPLNKFAEFKRMCGGGVLTVGAPGNDRVITSGNLIIDGHHRWSSLFAIAGPEAQIATINIGLPETDAASVLAATQVAIASTISGKVPKATAGKSNILGKGETEILNMIYSAYESGEGEKGPILTDDWMEKFISDPALVEKFGLTLDMAEDIEMAREAVIEKVAKNLAQLNQPAPGAPKRDYMPQLDAAAGGVQGVLDAFKQGTVNYKEPFVIGDEPRGGRARDYVSDSYRRGGFVLERWQRLAGVIKG